MSRPEEGSELVVITEELQAMETESMVIYAEKAERDKPERLSISVLEQ